MRSSSRVIAAFSRLKTDRLRQMDTYFKKEKNSRETEKFVCATGRTLRATHSIQPRGVSCGGVPADLLHKWQTKYRHSCRPVDNRDDWSLVWESLLFKKKINFILSYHALLSCGSLDFSTLWTDYITKWCLFKIFQQKRGHCVMINLSYTEGRTRAAAAAPKSSPTLSHCLTPVSFFLSLLVTSFFCNTEQGHLEH